MGFSISWFGFENKSKAEVLALFGLRDLGTVDEANGALFSVAELPTGWTILFVNDYEFGGDAEVLAEVSRVGYVVACQAEEHVMASAARGYRDGREEWQVVHDSSRGRDDIAVRGQPPARLTKIRRRLAAQQQEPGEWPRVDFLFDVPVELAASETGYRHDRHRFDWGQPQFTAAEIVRRGG
jgi:hypothetical protein